MGENRSMSLQGEISHLTGSIYWDTQIERWDGM